MKNKPIIYCPECNKPYIKQYLSQHIKRKHKNIDYSKIIKRGMRYKFKIINNIFLKSTEFYCNICKIKIKNKCKYIHYKSIMHNQLLNLFDKSKIEKGLNKNTNGNCKLDSDNTNLIGNNKGFVINIKNPSSKNEFEKINNLYYNNFSEEISKVKECFSNIIKSEINFNNINSEKLAVNSNKLISFKQNHEISENSSISQIRYVQISNGLIPMNFLSHQKGSLLNDNDFSYDNHNIFEKRNDNQINLSFNSESSSCNEPNSLKSQTYSLMSVSEFYLRKNIDGIFQKLVNKENK